jgi:hypothetical protein
VIHGLGSLDATETIIVLGALALSALYLALAYGAWTLKPWGWTLGVIAGAATIVYMTAVLVRGWRCFVCSTVRRTRVSSMDRWPHG